MDFANEPWIRLYVRDSLTWLRLGFDGQTVLMHLLRRANLAGAIDLDGMEPWQACITFCGAPEPLAKRGTAQLIKLGVAVLRGGWLVFPRFEDAQTTPASSAQRMREHRARNAIDDGPDTTVTKRNAVPVGGAEGQVTTWDPVMGARRRVTGPGPALAAKGAGWLAEATGLEPYSHSGRWLGPLADLGGKPAAELDAAAKVLRVEGAKPDVAPILTPQHVIDHWPVYKAGKAPGGRRNGNGKHVPPGTDEVEAARAESARCRQAYQRARSQEERDAAQQQWLEADRRLQEAKERHGWTPQS